MVNFWQSFHCVVALTALYLPASRGQRICNNSPALCNRKYNNATYLGAHDSPFVRNAANGYSLFGNQYYNSTTQLDAGVRLLTGQIHKNGNSWDLCHTNCIFLNGGSLTDWLKGIKAWLDKHSNEVVTILLVNSDNANATTLNTLFQAADRIDNYAYTPPQTNAATNDWPTLNSMIDQNKRLVVWIADLPPSSNTVAPYLLDQFTFVFENNYDIADPATFSCEPDRPSQLKSQPIASVLSSGYLPLMNHFLYTRLNDAIEFPAEDKVENTNAATGTVGNLGASARNCTSFYAGRPPTYILVDFFNVARAIDTVDALNGVTNQVSGRLSLPDTVNRSRADSLVSLIPIPLGSSTSTAPPGTLVTSTMSSTPTAASTSTSSTSAYLPTPTSPSNATPAKPHCRRNLKYAVAANALGAFAAM